MAAHEAVLAAFVSFILVVSGGILFGSSIAYPILILAGEGEYIAKVCLILFFSSFAVWNAFQASSFQRYGAYTAIAGACFAGALLLSRESAEHKILLIPICVAALSFLNAAWGDLWNAFVGLLNLLDRSGSTQVRAGFPAVEKRPPWHFQHLAPAGDDNGDDDAEGNIGWGRGAQYYHPHFRSAYGSMNSLWSRHPDPSGEDSASHGNEGDSFDGNAGNDSTDSSVDERVAPLPHEMEHMGPSSVHSGRKGSPAASSVCLSELSARTPPDSELSSNAADVLQPGRKKAGRRPSTRKAEIDKLGRQLPQLRA